jgi:hypothetical protein
MMALVLFEVDGKVEVWRVFDLAFGLKVTDTERRMIVGKK